MADENDVDTVTPLDGDGANVVMPTTSGEVIPAGFENVSREDYDTRGQTTVATPRGYAFVSSNKDIPVITHEGVNVTREQADELVAESDPIDGKVYIVTDESKEG